jgi:colicin import membrane protein
MVNKKYLIFSFAFHALILVILIAGLDFTSPLAVVENTNNKDVISAVVLGDTPKSTILPQKILPPPVHHETTAAQKPQPKIKKDVIALDVKKKKIELKKELFAKDLLADIKKHKKIKQKQLTKKFENTLKEQAEKSLRQQLLNEEIKLQGTENRQSQGEINKYKALILQVISEHWLVPPQANKKLYCELMIRLAEGGMVLDVQIIKSSGDSALDSSAKAAVLKASPLPVPADAAAFSAFRQFVLKVKPENVVAQE